MTANNVSLPADALAFLASGKEFTYAPETCEAGAVTLLAADLLRTQYFPMDCQSTDVAEDDPHQDELGCYLVQGIDLIASSTGGYEGTGLLLWLPREARYATWDSSHQVIVVFDADVTWAKIAEAPAQHINSQWGDMFEDSVAVTCLEPWNCDHPYSSKQYYEPLDELPSLESEDDEDDEDDDS